jgi:hypothetical protein
LKHLAQTLAGMGGMDDDVAAAPSRPERATRGSGPRLYGLTCWTSTVEG